MSKGVEPLNCFRVAIRDMPFGRMGEVFALSVQIDSRMAEYGFMNSARGDMIELTGRVRYIVRDLMMQVESLLLKKLTGEKP